MSANAQHVFQRHRLDVTDYYRMAEAGILGEDDRCELIEGEIIDRAPIGSDHASTVARLNRFTDALCCRSGHRDCTKSHQAESAERAPA